MQSSYCFIQTKLLTAFFLKKKALNERDVASLLKFLKIYLLELSTL